MTPAICLLLWLNGIDVDREGCGTFERKADGIHQRYSHVDPQVGCPVGFWTTFDTVWGNQADVWGCGRIWKLREEPKISGAWDSIDSSEISP